jgi:hypothetical protein
MTNLEYLPFEPFFLQGSKGPLFCVYFPPVATDRGNILFIPPFADEMNRSRSMVAMQARAFAAKGFGTLLIDLYAHRYTQLPTRP